MFGILLFAALFIADIIRFFTDNEEFDGFMLFARPIVSFVGALLCGGTFWTALLWGVGWGIIGFVVSMFISEYFDDSSSECNEQSTSKSSKPVESKPIEATNKPLPEGNSKMNEADKYIRVLVQGSICDATGREAMLSFWGPDKVLTAYEEALAHSQSLNFPSSEDLHKRNAIYSGIGTYLFLCAHLNGDAISDLLNAKKHFQKGKPFEDFISPRHCITYIELLKTIVETTGHHADGKTYIDAMKEFYQKAYHRTDDVMPKEELLRLLIVSLCEAEFCPRDITFAKHLLRDYLELSQLQKVGKIKYGDDLEENYRKLEQIVGTYC